MSAVIIDNLTKTYPGDVQALKGISLTVEKGDFFALLGPNGAGKSTTIGVLCSLVKKDQGQVKIFDYDIDKEFTQAKYHIGVVAQEINFNQFERVIDIVTTQGGYYGLPKKLAKERAEHYIQTLGLWNKRFQRSRSLSGGMKRRLMIARALVHEPELLILDEPTAGVDIEIRRSMWEFLGQLNQEGRTIILTTHYLEEAEQLCKKIAIIDEGKIVSNTSTKALLQQLCYETFVLDCTQPIPHNFTLKDIPFIIKDAEQLEVTIDKKAGLNALFKQLTKQKVQVSSMRNKSNRLEELFMEKIKKESV